MPNYVTNIISFAGDDEAISALKNHVKNESVAFDFNKIKSLPKCLEGYESHLGILNRVKNALGVPLAENELLASLESKNRTRLCFEPVKELEIQAVIQGIANFKECGYIYWYDWALDNWGTKWNCMNVEDRNGSIEFQTAWSHPKKILLTLSAQFADVEIRAEYADEDIGYNCGYLSYKNGIITESNIAPNQDQRSNEEDRKWVEMALKLNNRKETVDDWFEPQPNSQANKNAT